MIWQKKGSVLRPNFSLRTN